MPGEKNDQYHRNRARAAASVDTTRVSVLNTDSSAPTGSARSVHAIFTTFVLDEVAPDVTRLLVRVRGGPGYRFHGLPLPLTRLVVRVVHFVMQRKQLLGIARRAERTPALNVAAPHDARGKQQDAA